jgi:hypothetical protein
LNVKNFSFKKRREINRNCWTFVEPKAAIKLRESKAQSPFIQEIFPEGVLDPGCGVLEVYFLVFYIGDITEK